MVGFAAETEELEKHAAAKLIGKGCDWIVANDVSEQAGTFGGDLNTVDAVHRTDAEVLARAQQARGGYSVWWRESRGTLGVDSGGLGAT